MKYLLICALCLLGFTNLNASSVADVDVLIQKRQYLAAWKLLNKTAATSPSVNIHLEKIDFALKYFTKTINHQAFAFSNLKEGENLLEQRVRAEKEMIPVFSFKADELIDSLLSTNPENARIFKTQGDYYYDIFILFGKDWKVNKQEVLRRMYLGYTKAYEAGVYDYLSLYALGYFYNINEQSNEAIKFFEKSLELDSTHAPTHYNLAYLYTERDSNEVALFHAWNAYQNYKYINYKNDAGQMAASLLGQLNRHEEAIGLLLAVDRLIPNTYQTYYYFLNSFLALKRLAEAEVTAINMFAKDWKSHTINTDLIELYTKYGFVNELITFYNKQLTTELYDMEFRGHVYLHMAQAYSNVSEDAKMLEYVQLAKESFNICYDSGHPVFRVLAKMEK